MRFIKQNPIQPLINPTLAGGWAIASARNPIANWDADHEWTIPLGLDVTKVKEIDTQPMSLGIQYHGNVVRPASTGSSQLRLIVSFLLPKTASKKPKEVAP